MVRDKDGDKVQTSVRLSPEAKLLIDELAKTFGISQTAVLEMAIRKWARQENITVTPEMLEAFRQERGESQETNAPAEKPDRKATRKSHEGRRLTEWISKES